MKVLYDHQIFESQTYGGISNYFANLYFKLPKQQVETEISILYGNNGYLNKLPLKPHFDPYTSFVMRREFPAKRRIYNWVNNMVLKRKNSFEHNREHAIATISKQNFDVFHPTYFDPYFLDKLKKPLVLTVHDMIHEIYPEFLHGDPTLFHKPLLIEKADHIIAVSETTKRDLMRIYQVAPKKITVVYHGINENIDTKQTGSSNKFPGQYILFVGKRDGYKNFLTFIQAIAKTLIKHNISLVCVGQIFDAFESELIEKLGITRNVIQTQASNEELYDLYKHALCFVFPSLYEGFGIPLLEAMRAGCPMAVSNIDVFREVAKNAALYFNPKEIDSIRCSIEELINNSEKRKELELNGKENLGYFTMEKLIENTAAIYKKVQSPS